ncbi:hypothetical protein SO802_017811 [Lithocarpus litseifolius]|uniref:Uncharacterized protein n=1 Tax=Lithocarpus litseifolius TaxID=425828 RepID=A0AAW2CL38_9ROSI
MLAIDVVRIHLVSNGICRGYRHWTFHGESSSRKTSIRTPITSVQENSNENSNMREMLHHMFPMHDMVPEPMEEDMASNPTVGGPGVEQPTQSPNKESFQFLKLLKDIEEPCYEGLSYEKIDGYLNDCMLFWKENSNLETFSNCNHSRWASNMAGVPKSTNAPSKKVKKKAAKILKWFPLKPRLK